MPPPLAQVEVSNRRHHAKLPRGMAALTKAAAWPPHSK